MPAKVQIEITTTAKKATSDLQEFSRSWTEFKSKIDSVKEVAAAFGKAWDYTAGAVMKQDDQIKKLSVDLGVTAEEASRLLGVSEKYGVTAEQLTSAMDMMVKRGFAPNLETLARLSDEFNSIQDPVQRAARMSELLGRNWSSLNELLEKGGNAIRNTSASLDENLVRTEAQVQATEDLTIALNDLNQQWEAMRNKVFGNAIGALNTLLSWTDKLTLAYTEHSKQVLETSQSYSEYLTELERAAKERGFTIDQQGRLITQVGNVIVQNYALEASQWAANHAAGQMRAVNQEVEKTLEVLPVKAHQWTLAEYAVKEAADAARIATQQEKDAADILANSMGELTKQLVFTQASQGLTSEQALELAKKMGLIDYNTENAVGMIAIWRQQLADGKITLQEYIALVERLGADIGAIQGKSVYIDVITRYLQEGQPIAGNPNNMLVPGESGSGDLPPATGSGDWNGGSYSTGGSGDTKPPIEPLGHDAGGHMDAGEPGIVGEKGPEGWIPDHPGTVIPNNQLGGIFIAPGAIQISGVTDPERVARLVMDKLGQLTRSALKSGKGYAGG